MARPYRLQAENCFYHITSRGDDRKKIFANNRDYSKFLEYLKISKDKFKFYLCAYCLMSNHYHLFLKITQPNLSQIMQYINTAYTIYYNVKHKRCGHLFQGRFKSIIVESDSYFLDLTRYIHLNPLRANIVESPEAYRWSSYNAYIADETDNFIDKDKVKELLLMDKAAYRQFVLEGIKQPQEIFKNVYAGFILGGDKFIKDKLSHLYKQVESRDFAYKRAVKNIIKPQEVINVVADYFKLDAGQMCKSKKRPMTAKKAALYLLRRKTGLTNAQIGELFDMKLAAVSRAVLIFEREIRRNEELNEMLSQISYKIEV